MPKQSDQKAGEKTLEPLTGSGKSAAEAMTNKEFSSIIIIVKLKKIKNIKTEARMKLF